MKKDKDLTKQDKLPGLLILILVILVLGLSVSGWIYYNYYEKYYTQGIENQIMAISNMKVKELMDWKQERMSDAEYFRSSEVFTGLFRQIIDHPGNSDNLKEMFSILDQFHKTQHYGMILLDAHGQPIIFCPDSIISVYGSLSTRKTRKDMHPGKDIAGLNILFQWPGG